MRRAAAAESHDDGGEGESSLHTVLPDALQDVQREVDVQVAQEHDAVAVLREEINRDTSSRSPMGVSGGNFMTAFHKQKGRILLKQKQS